VNAIEGPKQTEQNVPANNKYKNRLNSCCEWCQTWKLLHSSGFTLKLSWLSRLCTELFPDAASTDNMQRLLGPCSCTM